MPVGEGTARRMTVADKELMLKMKDNGASFSRIADTVGVSLETVNYHLLPRRKEKYIRARKSRANNHPNYMKEWLKSHPNYLRDNLRRRVLHTPSGKIRRLNKRPYPANSGCELCSKSAKILAYHHWRKDDPNIGLWLCVNCHKIAELFDSPSLAETEGIYRALQKLAASQTTVIEQRLDVREKITLIRAKLGGFF